MSNVIDFLEKAGQDAKLLHASRNQLELLLADTEIEPELQAAILAKDQARIEVLLGQQNVCCMLAPGKEDDEEEEEIPAQDDEVKALHAVLPVVATAG